MTAKMVHDEWSKNSIETISDGQESFYGKVRHIFRGFGPRKKKIDLPFFKRYSLIQCDKSYPKNITALLSILHHTLLQKAATPQIPIGRNNIYLVSN